MRTVRLLLLPLGLICWSDLGEENGQNEGRIKPHHDDKTHSPPIGLNNGLTDSGDIDKASDRRREAERWEFQT